MMTHEQAVTRLAELEAELASLKATLTTTPPTPPRLIQPGRYFITSGEGGFETDNNSTPYTDPTTFATEDQAEAYADALNTLLLLRRQPGTVPAKHDTPRYLIRLDDSGTVGLVIESKRFLENQATYLSPCFTDAGSARTALDALGAERILAMFKTLHGVA